MNLQNQKYQKKSKSISSAETNYLLQFEMRYPVNAATRFITNCMPKNGMPL